MAWTPNNIQYTINGLSGSSVRVMNPVGSDNGDYCGLLLRPASGSGRLNEQLAIQQAAQCRPCLRQIQQPCMQKVRSREPCNQLAPSIKVNPSSGPTGEILELQETPLFRDAITSQPSFNRSFNRQLCAQTASLEGCTSRRCSQQTCTSVVPEVTCSRAPMPVEPTCSTTCGKQPKPPAAPRPCNRGNCKPEVPCSKVGCSKQQQCERDAKLKKACRQQILMAKAMANNAGF